MWASPVVCNGEIYNAPALRGDLETRETRESSRARSAKGLMSRATHSTRTAIRAALVSANHPWVPIV